MKTYSFSEARANLARLLDEARHEPVVIRRRRGDAFTIVPQEPGTDSPFAVATPIKRQVSRKEITQALRESRRRA